MVWRNKIILARRSCVSRLGRPLGDDPLRSDEGPLFQRIKIVATDVEPTTQTSDGWRNISKTVRRLCKLVCRLLAGCTAACVTWFIPLNGLTVYPIARRGSFELSTSVPLVGEVFYTFSICSAVGTCESAGVIKHLDVLIKYNEDSHILSKQNNPNQPVIRAKYVHAAYIWRALVDLHATFSHLVHVCWSAV